MYTIQTSFERVTRVAFSTDGRLAALSGEFSWECEVWPLPPGAEAAWTHEDEEPFAFGLAFDPRTGHVLHGDAKEGLVASGPEDHLGWDVPGGPLRAFAVSPGGDRLVCGCELWDGQTSKQNAPDALISFTRVGKRTDWKPGAVFDGEGFVFSHLAFFADGKRFASVEWSIRRHRGRSSQGAVPTLRIHDAKTLGELDAAHFKKPAGDLVACGNRVVVCGDKSFRVWDADDLAAEPVVVKSGRAPLGSIAADPAGRFVLTATGDSVSVWASDSWTTDKTYEWSSGYVTSLAVSPDGLLVAAGTATGKVVVWDSDHD